MILDDVATAGLTKTMSETSKVGRRRVPRAELLMKGEETSWCVRREGSFDLLGSL